MINIEKIKHNEDDIPSMNLRRVHFSTILFSALEVFQILEAAAPPRTLQQCTENLEISKINSKYSQFTAFLMQELGTEKNKQRGLNTFRQSYSISFAV